MTEFNAASGPFNTFMWGGGTPSDVSDALFETEMDRLRDSVPRTKVEFISTAGVTTDISNYFHSGGNIERVKERAPDEIQAGDFDIVLFNHDDKFSEYKATSLFYNAQYHGARIRISQGFRMPDGSYQYEPQATGYIDELQAHESGSKVTLRCRDLIRRVLDETLHLHPTAEVPSFGSGNTGDGTCSDIATKPFKTKNEDWTLTCTTPGGDGVAVFSVVGSVTGSKGNATSGTEFSTGTGTGGIKFTISAGSTNWAVGDTITFSTKQYPEWTLVHPAKIIWSVLTGYNYDSNTQEVWSGLVLNLDRTQSSANTDINFESFQEAVENLSDAYSGYIAYDEPAVEFLEGLLLLILGAIFTDGDGKINLKTFRPSYTNVIREFSDQKKITALGYNRSVDEVINYAVVSYKKTNVWEFSDEEVELDGVYVVRDTSSITKYGTLSFEVDSRWFSANGEHAQDFANRLVAKFGEPPLVITFDTGMDALRSEIGDRIYITDSKYNFSGLLAEISHVTKKFDSAPTKISITARRDENTAFSYGFLGSSADEGDSISPQASTYGSATASDKLFCYLGAAGDSAPNYVMF